MTDDASRVRAYIGLASYYYTNHSIESIRKKSHSFRSDTRERACKALRKYKMVFMWQGNVKKSLDGIEDCHLISIDDEINYHNKLNLIKHVEEFQTYIENNCHLS